MDKKEKVDAFLKELTDLCEKYNFELVSEGNPVTIYDLEERDWICDIGTGLFDNIYKADYDD